MVRDEAPFLGVSYKWFNVKTLTRSHSISGLRPSRAACIRFDQTTFPLGELFTGQVAEQSFPSASFQNTCYGGCPNARRRPATELASLFAAWSDLQILDCNLVTFTATTGTSVRSTGRRRRKQINGINWDRKCFDIDLRIRWEQRKVTWKGTAN
jgi:hypothetical protein